MSADGVKRKLTAILSADVKGYSRLMGEDEFATVETLKQYREVMGKFIEQYGGRVVDSPGDNMLSEFTSVVNAVECAANVQENLKDRNAGLPESRRMEFRIGIHLGDVIEDQGRLYGDGVNIAARIEGLAEGGGICISGSVYEQIEGKVAFGFEYLGERNVKNIKRPVRIYRVLTEDKPVPQESIDIKLPDKPSIAVLPFVNMSGDPAQEYFSDGVTEEIITGLSKIPEMFVIARNSSFTYKGQSVKVQQVGKELGVRYVLEGSVRKAGDRVRITAQLIDALTGHHLWAERYDRTLEDIFALQDEITIQVMRAMQVKLTEGEQACEWLKRGSENLEAYEKGMKGMECFRQFSPEGNVRARKLFEEGIDLDPDSSGNYVMLAWTHLVDVLIGRAESPEESMKNAVELTKKALDLDDSQADAHSLLGYIFLLKRDYDHAIAEGEQAVRLNPNGADGQVWLAMILTSAGRSVEAVDIIKKAMRLNPFPPNWYFFTLADAYRLSGQYDRAVEEYIKALRHTPDLLLAYIGMAASYSLLGREKEAAEAAAKVLMINPEFSLDSFEKSVTYKMQTDKERFIDALRKAGLQ